VGKPLDPDYFKKYRASHPDYAARDRAQRRARKTRSPRGDRSAEYARRNAKRGTTSEPLPMLYPHLQVGKTIAFWEDELRLDLEQERVLAELEGRDPVQAVHSYRARERGWYLRLGWLPDEA
jgi:hypothetical protein